MATTKTNVLPVVHLARPAWVNRYIEKGRLTAIAVTSPGP